MYDLALFDNILLCADIDGTLTDDRGVISKKNAEAIRYFQQNGGLFTVATGRRPDHLGNFSDIFTCNTYIIALNGTVLFDEVANRAVSVLPMDDNALSVAEQIYTAHTGISQLYVHTLGTARCFEGRNDPHVFLSETSEPVLDIIFVQSRQDTLYLRDTLPEKYPNYGFRRSWGNGVEMFSASAGKGRAVAELKRMTGSRLSVSMGNYDNDIDMLRDADIGIAVSSAPENVKQAANLVTVSCNEDAVAEIIFNRLPLLSETACV